jgi:hypothetical protein
MERVDGNVAVANFQEIHMSTLESIGHLFVDSVNAYVQGEKKQGSGYGKLIEFASTLTNSVEDTKQLDVLKSTLETAEGEYKKGMKAERMPAAYRSAKSVIVTAVSMSISLIDEEGKYKGKTQLEKEIKEGKPGKPEFEKFKSAMNTATLIFGKLDTLDDVRNAKELVRQLADLVIKTEASMMEEVKLAA